VHGKLPPTLSFFQDPSFLEASRMHSISACAVGSSKASASFCCATTRPPATITAHRHLPSRCCLLCLLEGKGHERLIFRLVRSCCGTAISLQDCQRAMCRGCELFFLCLSGPQSKAEAANAVSNWDSSLTFCRCTGEIPLPLMPLWYTAARYLILPMSWRCTSDAPTLL